MLFELVAIADSCGFLLGFYVCAITMPYVIYNVRVITRVMSWHASSRLNSHLV